MAFELNEFDRRLLKFGDLFRERFMDIQVDLPLEGALDLAWLTMGECFSSDELLIRQELLDKYYRPLRDARG
jgi:V/A-type H+-transporting ATPase subunit B